GASRQEQVRPRTVDGVGPEEVEWASGQRPEGDARRQALLLRQPPILRTEDLDRVGVITGERAVGIDRDVLGVECRVVVRIKLTILAEQADNVPAKIRERIARADEPL